jgi:excisionase family DNA binding protein
MVSYCVGMERMHVDLDKPWLTVADICEYMDVSTFVVTSVLRSGELPAVKFGREWRVSRDDFEDWINGQRAISDQPSAVRQTSTRGTQADA